MGLDTISRRPYFPTRATCQPQYVGRQNLSTALSPPPAPEARQIVAHGENRGFNRTKAFPAPAGASECQRGGFSFAPSGAGTPATILPTVTPWATCFRRSATRFQFSQPFPARSGSGRPPQLDHEIPSTALSPSPARRAFFPLTHSLIMFVRQLDTFRRPIAPRGR